MKTLKRTPYLHKSDKLNRAIQKLVADGASSQDADLLAQMMTTVLKLRDEKVDRGDLKILNTSLKELRWAFRVFRPFRHVRKVSVFGSARVKPDDPVYRSAQEFGGLMAQSGWMIVTGASTGIMRAGNEGAGRAFSFGVNIRLPFEQDVNPVIEGDRKLIHFKYFFTRKLVFVKESDAICLFPGGFGTLDEGFEALTLVQTGKTLPRPIVLVESPNGNYWRPWLNFVKKSLLGRRMIDPADMNLFQLVSSARGARDVILNYYRNYHSMRFVGDRLVIRLEKALTASQLKKLSQKFRDILVSGSIQTSGPLAAEAAEVDTSHLARLVLSFDRRSYGRLKQMIDEINKAGE